MLRLELLAYSLGAVVNSLLPVPLLPERARLRGLKRPPHPQLDRWAEVHFGG